MLVRSTESHDEWYLFMDISAALTTVAYEHLKV